MRSGDTSAECGVRNAECIGRWSIRAAGSRDRTRRLNSAFRIPHSALGGAVMGGVWLAIDTATEIASVAAGRPPRADSGAQVQGARRHAAEIVRLVDFVLGRLGITPRDLEGIVVGDGPGSFTGLRIGWGAAKGVAQQTGVALRAGPSLMAPAAGVARQPGAGASPACCAALPGQGEGGRVRGPPAAGRAPRG